MSVPITLSPISASKFVTPASRYIKQNVIYYGPNNLIAFDTYIRKPYVPQGNEKVMMISKGVEYRPDLVSNVVFGFPDNWWRIMEANQMIDILEFKAGVTIILPNQII